MRNLKKLKANDRLAVGTNAVIAYREGITEVCNIMDSADVLFLPVIVLGELLYVDKAQNGLSVKILWNSTALACVKHVIYSKNAS
jgi:hypothetical protein